jgi:hypothetical protein
MRWSNGKRVQREKAKNLMHWFWRVVIAVGAGLIFWGW